MEKSVTDIPIARKASVDNAHGSVAPSRPDELMFELGLWLGGLESFLGAGSSLFAENNGSRAKNWTNDFRLANSALHLCSSLIQRSINANAFAEALTTADELDELSTVLRDGIILSEGLIRAEPLDFGEWRSWCAMLSERLRSAAAFDRLIRYAECIGDKSLPDTLAELLNSPSLSFSDRADISQVMPRFARVLKWLSVIDRMLANDEPLKHTILIFARVHEQTADIIRLINNRLSRFKDEDAELFRVLDIASYTASIELRKVFEQELAGLIAIRPAPLVYARMETACSLLRDGFQLVLTGFAKMLHPDIEIVVIFPGFGRKLERSLKLRQDIGAISKLVRSCEENPTVSSIAAVNDRLASFCEGSMLSLFYKDRESVERFYEEIRLTSERKDLVPILHRLGAYLETLFSHVSHRAVLADHPYDPDQD